MNSEQLHDFLFDILSVYGETYQDQIPENTLAEIPTILYYFMNELPGFYADDTYFDRVYFLHIDIFQEDKSQDRIEKIERDLKEIFFINNYSKQITKEGEVYHFLLDVEIQL